MIVSNGSTCPRARCTVNPGNGVKKIMQVELAAAKWIVNTGTVRNPPQIPGTDASTLSQWL